MNASVTHEGIRLDYDLAGAGRPLLVIGGLAADRIFWGLSRPLLADRRTLCFDNRDAGTSGRATGPYTPRDMARDALAVMDAAGWERADILGHSLGGVIAQELAACAPERVDRLILANSFARQDGYTRSVMELLVRLRRELADPVTYVSALATFTLGPRAIAAAGLEAIARQSLVVSPLQEIDAFERQVAACREIDTRALLPGITAPTLVLYTPDDRFFAPSFAHDLAQALPDARLAEVPFCGHCPMIEAPEAFAAKVRDFLDQG